MCALGRGALGREAQAAWGPGVQAPYEADSQLQSRRQDNHTQQTNQGKALAPRGHPRKSVVWLTRDVQDGPIELTGTETAMAITKPEGNADETKATAKKWSKPLTDAGWTALPTVIFQRQKALGLDSMDINIILHLASYWWKAENEPYPAKATIAAAMGVHPRTVQKHIARLQGAGFVKRTTRFSASNGQLTNEYSFAGLIKAATPFALERIEEKKKRMGEATARAKRKKPVLTVVK